MRTAPHRRTARRPAVVAASGLVVAAVLGGCGLVTTGSGSAAGPTVTTSTTPTLEPTTPAPTTSAPTTSAPPTSSPSATPTTTPAKPKPTPEPTPKPKPPVNPDLIKAGEKGAHVLALQKRLSALGYWLGRPDGTYGDLTAQAVLALQKTAGIGRDGTFGPATKRALAAGTRPSPHSRSDGMDIDLARQVMTIVRGGRVTMILNTSTGSGQSYTQQGSQHVAVTPAGSYTTFRSVNGEDHAPLGVLWRPRYFNNGIAVHGYTSVPAYPASHGCARVSNPAMNMLWDTNLMPIGGRVTVF